MRGIVTRKDLDHAAGFGPWRRNRKASRARAQGQLARPLSATTSLARGIISSLASIPSLTRSPPSLRANGSDGEASHTDHSPNPGQLPRLMKLPSASSRTSGDIHSITSPTYRLLANLQPQVALLVASFEGGDLLSMQGLCIAY